MNDKDGNFSGILFCVGVLTGKELVRFLMNVPQVVIPALSVTDSLLSQNCNSSGCHNLHYKVLSANEPFTIVSSAFGSTYGIIVFLFGGYTLKAIKSCQVTKYELIFPKLRQIV